MLFLNISNIFINKDMYVIQHILTHLSKEKHSKQINEQRLSNGNAIATIAITFPRKNILCTLGNDRQSVNNFY